MSDDKVIIEAAVQGREIDVDALQYPDGRLVAGPPLEVSLPADRAFFDHGAKYADRRTSFHIPAVLGPRTTRLVQRQAAHAFDTLACQGYLRVDFLVRADGSTVVNEVNTAPGLTAMSQFPRIWHATGLSYRELLTIPITTALTID